jgi:glycosyltransferase involved in cell wall biosynthesis
MHLLGYVPDEQMMKYLHEAKVYVQVSAHEGFGISLAEAMLCECVPVVTDRGAIPEVVGDCGFYVPYGEPEATAEAIKSALQSDLGPNARNRIKNNFSIKEREKRLISFIWEVLGKDPIE